MYKEENATKTKEKKEEKEEKVGTFVIKAPGSGQTLRSGWASFGREGGGWEGRKEGRGPFVNG